MKIVFAGTPNFAVPSLKTLMKKHNLLAVITQPNCAQGRNQKKQASTIKQAVLKYNQSAKKPITIFTKSINQLEKELTKLKPDLIVVVAYGKILNSKTLQIPKFGCINLHASLLPKYPGASPIQATILAGDKYTGISLIKMTTKIDAGPVLAQKKIKITPNDTAGTLHDKLASLGANVLKNFCKNIDNKIAHNTRTKDNVTYSKNVARDIDVACNALLTKKITTKDAKINPLNQPAEFIERQIRAFNPWPGAWIKIKTKKDRKIRLKIFKAKIIKQSNKSKTKQKLIIYQNQPALICKNNTLLILTKVQVPGRQKITGKEFVNGYWKKII